MTEEEILTQEEDSGNQMYLDEIAKLKANTVSKEKYQKLQEENRNLLNTIVNGSEKSTDESEVPKPDIDQLRKDLFYNKNGLSNLEYVEKALELRNAVLEEEGRDIFVGAKHGTVPSEAAYQSAAKTAQIFQECIEAANGSSDVFTAELMRRTADTMMPRR